MEAAADKPSYHWPTTIGVILIACLSMALVWERLKPVAKSEPVPSFRLPVNLGDDGDLALNLYSKTSLRLSPDGKTLAFLARSDEGGPSQLFLRHFDELRVEPIRAVKNADAICFSPQRDWIAFRDADESMIKKIDLADDRTFPLCQAELLYGLDWSEDGWIIFAERYGEIQRVSAQSDRSESLTTLAGTEKAHHWPHVLPGARAILFSAGHDSGNVSTIKIKRLPTGDETPLGISGHHVRYLNSGHMVFMKKDALWGIGFDLKALKVQGQAKRLVLCQL